eukprot:gene3792-2682_t
MCVTYRDDEGRAFGFLTLGGRDEKRVSFSLVLVLLGGIMYVYVRQERREQEKYKHKGDVNANGSAAAHNRVSSAVSRPTHLILSPLVLVFRLCFVVVTFCCFLLAIPVFVSTGVRATNNEHKKRTEQIRFDLSFFLVSLSEQSRAQVSLTPVVHFKNIHPPYHSNFLTIQLLPSSPSCGYQRQ